ncbi:MAG: EscU/YscU/HrcU family type III secretion system export apparatus switch protein [Burkholderiales bacterium]|nr:EscU/YscU/HrcU family type III secretion system export apparatus switch protein [Burkholderiales bacterium]
MSRYMRQAVALAYGKNPVPVVTAKGDDDLAMRMIEEARQQGVFISEDPQLLALLSRLNVDEEIPQELYTAVAVVLSWVYWLKGMRPGDEKTSSDPVDPTQAVNPADSNPSPANSVSD